MGEGCKCACERGTDRCSKRVGYSWLFSNDDIATSRVTDLLIMWLWPSLPRDNIYFLPVNLDGLVLWQKWCHKTWQSSTLLAASLTLSSEHVNGSIFPSHRTVRKPKGADVGWPHRVERLGARCSATPWLAVAPASHSIRCPILTSRTPKPPPPSWVLPSANPQKLQVTRIGNDYLHNQR